MNSQRRLVPHAPDFLWSLLALMNFMRLSYNTQPCTVY
jgi:hypothetical protein